MGHSFDREAERLDTIVQLIDAPTNVRAELMEEYRQRSEAAFAPTTLRIYRQITASFTRWCQDAGHDPIPPVAPRIVAIYVDHLGGKIKASTIETRLWAISEMHRAAFLSSPCRHRLVELALKGVKRKYGAAVRQAPALCKRDILEAIGRLGNSRRDVRDKAVLWVATDSWCRASEIIAFRVKDLERQSDETSLLYVTRSKTDPYGEGAYAFLSEVGTEAVLRWSELAELKAEDPLLTKSQLSACIQPLNSSTISRILKRCTGRPDVSAHSTRVGGVHDAFRLAAFTSSRLKN
jgi:integrase